MDGSHEPEAEPPHDILAAEAFAVGAGDPGLHREEAHDVLAADAFPLPAPEPHAVPPGWSDGAPPPAGSPATDRPRASLPRIAAVFGAFGVLAVARRRLRRKRAPQ